MSKNTIVPSYLALVSNLLTLCDELGVTPVRAATTSTLPENTGYCFLQFSAATNAAALIIPKSVGPKLCDIHIDASDLSGHVDLRRPNGAVLGHIDPAQVSDWPELISRLVGAFKRASQRASKTASAPAQDMSAFLAKLQTLGTGVKAPVAPTPAIEVVDEIEDMEDMEVNA